MILGCKRPTRDSMNCRNDVMARKYSRSSSGSRGRHLERKPGVDESLSTAQSGGSICVEMSGRGHFRPRNMSSEWSGGGEATERGKVSLDQKVWERAGVRFKFDVTFQPKPIRLAVPSRGLRDTQASEPGSTGQS